MTETKWKYMVLQSPWWGLQKVTSTFNKLGEGGWELVTIDRDIAYFKRPHPISIAISDPHRDLGEVEELNDNIKRVREYERWLEDNIGPKPDLNRANLRDTDLSEADLRLADLSGADLTGANLYGADLSGANLKEANLKEANLKEAKLYGAKLYGADLHGANLSYADLIDADLREADFMRANLRGADLYGANLRGANLKDANLEDVISDKHTIWPKGFEPK